MYRPRLLERYLATVVGYVAIKVARRDDTALLAKGRLIARAALKMLSPRDYADRMDESRR